MPAVPPAPPASPPRALLPPWQREWLAASMGCTIADAMFNPLEVLKVRRQMLARRASSTTASNAAAAAATASATAPPTGTLALARDAIKSRGLANGLWLPGLEATCYRAFSYTGFRIGMYPSGASHALVPIRPLRDAIVSRGAFGDADSIAARVAAGALTGAVGSAVFNPIDVVRIRMQGPTPYPSTLGAFVAIAKREGVVRGLWRGTDACVARAALLSGSQLATYDSVKKHLKANGGFEEGPGLHFAASFTSGIVAQTVTMPADTLKTLAMAGGDGGDGGKRHGGGPGTLGILTRVLRTHGVGALYRGYWPAMARQGPVMVIQMPIVEQFRRAFGLEYF
ncbi:mitochondrial carrier family [Micromonas pusilla CCMP1545]|uniref:Mitochondrial carrier family n=1 Tax=Micromonas pusilla (strain CCMP1545) TaxID=564608 RepID=C1MYB1_MICPC|nr:mitochondrial carrier family [Micromonas pusilla CCMP1545]EEH55315.1 mitochondrial carrier family [Micromonas pusilla CCMP1545]|eukprot:XP_003060546.1 mitochondrial carrier family [Micromonas pusilla CCMP1545]